MRKQFISATAATLCALCLGFAASAAEVAQYSLTADNAQVTAGNIVELSLRCDSAATPTAALSLQFTLPEGYAVYDVDSGSGIVSNELSYSYTDSTVFPLSHKSSETSLPSLNTGKFNPIRFSGHSDSSFR